MQITPTGGALGADVGGLDLREALPAGTSPTPLFFTATSRFQASYTNRRPASSPVMLPFASYVGVVAPPTDVTSFWALAVRACAVPLVVTPSKLPAAS